MQSAHSLDEQVYQSVDGKPHYMDIFYCLRKSTGPKTVSEIADDLDRNKQNLSKYLNEMEDRGLLRFEWKDGAKEWDLTSELFEATVHPEVVEREVEVEVERSYDSPREFLEEHTPIIYVLLVSLVTGLLLVALATIVDLLSLTSISPLGAIGGVLFWGSLTGLLTIGGMGWQTVNGGDD